MVRTGWPKRYIDQMQIMGIPVLQLILKLIAGAWVLNFFIYSLYDRLVILNIRKSRGNDTNEIWVMLRRAKFGASIDSMIQFSIKIAPHLRIKDEFRMWFMRGNTHDILWCITHTFLTLSHIHSADESKANFLRENQIGGAIFL